MVKKVLLLNRRIPRTENLLIVSGRGDPVFSLESQVIDTGLPVRSEVTTFTSPDSERDKTGVSGSFDGEGKVQPYHLLLFSVLVTVEIPRLKFDDNHRPLQSLRVTGCRVFPPVSSIPSKNQFFSCESLRGLNSRSSSLSTSPPLLGRKVGSVIHK